MIQCYSAIFVVLIPLIFQASITKAGDTEIWPIPTECPEVDPIDYTVHLQHETDCTKFYKCDNGKRVLFDCPAGLEFSPVLQVCVWPYEAQCTLGQETTEIPTNPPTEGPARPPNCDPECPWPDPLNYTVHLPYEGDCTKFYKCDNCIKVEFDCPDGLHFNPELEVCDWPENAGCENIAPTPTTQEPTDSTAGPTNPPTDSPTEAPTRPPNCDAECPWPDPLNYTVHLPYEGDCTKFYKCDNCIKVEFDCPDGLHFNPELEVCDWPENAGCEDIPTTPTTQEPTDSTAGPTNPPTDPPTEAPTRPPNCDPECPWPDPLNYTVHLPYEGDCTKFYKCDNCVKVEFDCPDGLHFNPELEVCDWPENAGCEDIPTTPTTQEPTDSTAGPTNPPTDPPTEAPTRPPNCDPECPWPDPLNYTVHLPYEGDCTKFYKCDNCIKVEFDCPDGLHFNPELEVCDWPENAGCEDIPSTPITQEPTDSTAGPTNPPTDPPTETPTRPPNCDPECPWPDPLNYTVHLPYEGDCTKFYKCDNCIKVEFDCPDGLHFNPELEVCDWPENAGCENIPTTPTTQEPTDSTAGPTNPPTDPPTETPTRPPNCDPECPWPDPLNYTVHLPYEGDCTKFYKCDNCIKVEFDCPDGLHFNPELEVCDWPENAGCEDIPTTPTTQEPTDSTAGPTNPPTDPPTEAPTRPPNCDPECPWPDPLNYTVHLPYEGDCTKFYKCDNCIKVEFDCPDGLHFNPELEVCDWPENAGCEDIPSTPITQEPTDSTAGPTNPPTDPPTETPTRPPNCDPECPWPDPLNYTVHLPYEGDCTKFYKCDNCIKVEFDCPDGLHFNPELEVCDWPENAGCEAIPTTPTTQEPTDSTAGPTNPPTDPPTETPTRPPNCDPECPWPDPLNYTVHLPYEGDCTKFYKCDNCIKVEFDCPDGLHFNPELEVCDWPENAGCEDIPTTPTTQEPTDSTAGPTNPPTDPPTEAPTRPPNCDPECPWPDPLNYTVHLPYEGDCTKFYKCDNCIKVEFDCPDGLHFNPELEVCDWPENAGCEDIPSTPITQEPTDSTAGPTNPPTDPPTETPTRPPNCDPECPWPDPLNYTVHLPYEGDCTKFYKCDNCIKVEFDCPDGLHFNPELEVCDWPENAGCENIPTTPTTQEPTDSTAGPTNPPTDPPTETPTRPPNCDPECPWPDPLNYTVHLPYEGDCTKFYKCDNCIKVEFDCPDGLHFNPELEVCDWPENAGCEDIPTTPTTQEPTDSTAGPTNPPTDPPTEAPTRPPNCDPECPWPDPLNYTVHLPYEGDCTKFYKCDNCIKVEFDCPDGLHFNPELEVCDWPENAGCEDIPTTPTTQEPTDSTAGPTNPPTDPPTETPTRPPNCDPECPWPDPLNYTVHLPYEGDCTKFYKCDNCIKVEFDCPDGLHFNPELEVCDWPENAGCEDIPTTPTTQEPTDSTAGPTNPPTDPPTETPTRPPNCDPECPWPDPLNYTVHLPYEGDCTKFYKCDNCIKVEFDCPDGLHFNPVLEVCDWPENAGCEDIPTTPITQEPTDSTAGPTNPPTDPPTETPTRPPNCDPECPWPDPLNYTVHLPYEGDCTKFYKCDNCIKVEFDCPDGLHFNPELEVCDWPENAGCEVQTTTTPESTTPTPPVNPCPDVVCQDSTIYLPYLGSVRKYIRCVKGQEVIETCPGSLIFDPYLATCNLEHLIEQPN